MKGVRCPRCNGSGVLPDDRAIGARMRARRQRAFVSLRELARRLDLSPPYLSDLELGRRHWNAKNLARYEAAL